MPSKINFATTMAAIALATLLSSAPTLAASVDLGDPAFAQTSGPTSIPIGHSEFCKVYRSECGAPKRVVAVEELSESNWRKLVAVNDQINREIVPVSDRDLYQVDEYWTYPQGYGDCEDIALAKRRALIAEGFDASTLLMSVVREANGEGHAVLMVRTDRGDLVLDNQDGMVRLWTDTPYQFLKRQSQSDAGQWVDIIDNRVVTVAQR